MEIKLILLFFSFFFAIRSVWRMDGETATKNTWFSLLFLSFFILTKVNDGLFYVNLSVCMAVLLLAVVFVRTATKNENSALETKTTTLIQLFISFIPLAAHVIFDDFKVSETAHKSTEQHGEALFLLTTLLTAFVGVAVIVLLKMDQKNEGENDR